MRYALIVMASIAVFSFSTIDASAQSSFANTYKVEVEYWFFDTDYYYWSTKLETQDYDDALDYFNELKVAQAHGQLNAVVPNTYWRYIAVDVRLVTIRPQLPIMQAVYRAPRYYQLPRRP